MLAVHHDDHVGRARPQAEAEAALPTGTAPEYAAAPPLSLWDQKHLLITSLQPEAKSPRPGISAPVRAAHAQISRLESGESSDPHGLPRGWRLTLRFLRSAPGSLHDRKPEGFGALPQ